jgi:hypothetical protein
MRITVRIGPEAATGHKVAANAPQGIREKPPMIMFCGLPVIVAVLPIFEAMGMARR